MSVKVKCLLNTNGKTFVFSSYAFSLCGLEIMFVFFLEGGWDCLINFFFFSSLFFLFYFTFTILYWFCHISK